jgi:hypothetical protein
MRDRDFFRLFEKLRYFELQDYFAVLRNLSRLFDLVAYSGRYNMRRKG